jgi:hypothetical protein
MLPGGFSTHFLRVAMPLYPFLFTIRDSRAGLSLSYARGTALSRAHQAPTLEDVDIQSSHITQRARDVTVRLQVK